MICKNMDVWISVTHMSKFSRFNLFPSIEANFEWMKIGICLLGAKEGVGDVAGRWRYKMRLASPSL